MGVLTNHSGGWGIGTGWFPMGMGWNEGDVWFMVASQWMILDDENDGMMRIERETNQNEMDPWMMLDDENGMEKS